jgi:hypothetical protein
VQKGATRSAGLLALALVGIGVVILLSNFLLLEGFNITTLWPLTLVIAGVAILLGGDLNSGQPRTFGITRGTVESASLEISAGEVDVRLHANQNEGRLVTGQYAAQSRPALDVRDTHTHLKMDRSATPWLSFHDWEINLATDLPWQVLISTSLGAVEADFSGIIVQSAVLATGMGDIRLTAPREAFEPVVLRSAVGDLHVYTPPGIHAQIHIHKTALVSVQVDENRYTEHESGVFIARTPRSQQPPVEIFLYPSFGNVYLA